jgi:hypothetical protein
VQLLTQGSQVISIDDDVCGPVVAVGTDAWTSAASAYEGVRSRRWADREGDPADRGALLTAHLDWLGSRVDGGRVVLTMSGLLGDCGADAPVFELMQQGRGAPRRRQVQRGCRQATLTPVDHLMSYAYGCINDELLPPFMPMGRNQDGAFAAAVAATLPGATLCHLPFYVQHIPATRRDDTTYADPASLVGRWRTNDAVGLFVQRTHFGVPASLEDLGNRLIEWGGRLERRGASELVDLHVLWLAQRAMLLETWASRAGFMARRRIGRQLAAVRKRCFDADALPVEWSGLGLSAFGSYIRRCGEMVNSWRAVREAVEGQGIGHEQWLQPGEGQR